MAGIRVGKGRDSYASFSAIWLQEEGKGSCFGEVLNAPKIKEVSFVHCRAGTGIDLQINEYNWESRSKPIIFKTHQFWQSTKKKKTRKRIVPSTNYASTTGQPHAK